MAFSFIKASRPARERDYEFDTLPGAPVLVVRYAGKGTPGYRSDEIRLANAARQRGAGEKLTEAGLAADFAEDARLFARHCIVTWRNVLEDDGTPAAFSPEKAEEFLLALIEHREDLFLGFRRFVRNAEHFVAAPSGGVELGKP